MATQGATSIFGIGEAAAKIVESQPTLHGTSFAQTLGQCEADGQYAGEVGAESDITIFTSPDQRTTKVYSGKEA